VSQQPVNPALLPPGLAPVQAPAKVGHASRVRQGGPGFADHLREVGSAQAVRFSNHALQRIERRGIDMSPDVLARLDSGVLRAAAKGAREALVLVDGTAFVVGVQARTVVTAVDPASMREHVFTNIDSAVIA
jgi:flagellar operon protein